MILSYFGIQSQCHELMHELSTQSRKYVKEKKDKLTGFIVKQKQVPRQLGYSIRVDEKTLVEEGKKFFFPDAKTLKEMQQFEAATGKQIKLKSVLYLYRTIIQLEFTEGFSSPVFGRQVDGTRNDEVSPDSVMDLEIAGGNRNRYRG